MECIWTAHQLNLGRLVGLQPAQARPEWTMLMRGRSLLGQSPRDGYDDTTSPQPNLLRHDL